MKQIFYFLMIVFSLPALGQTSHDTGAAQHLPVRTGQGFSNPVAGTGGLVVNEFMASNASTVQDQDGGYDDWIELYNGTGQDIDLEGYYLSDKPDNPAKWTFPAATIPAGGYIIVWADEEEEQQGLHANFKLSASGESIILSDPSGNVVDEVTFPALGEDVAYGRFPNGTGAFKELPVTFNAENREETSSAPDAVIPDLKVYPNPFHDRLFVTGGQRIENVRLMDVTGKTVFSDRSGKNEIMLPHLPRGFYFLEVNDRTAAKLLR